MRVLVHRNRFGAAAAFLKPGEGQLPAAAFAPMPHSHYASALAPVAARGPGRSWADHCKLLTSRARNGEHHWTEEDVPDGLTAHQALNFVRKRDVSALAS